MTNCVFVDIDGVLVPYIKMTDNLEENEKLLENAEFLPENVKTIASKIFVKNVKTDVFVLTNRINSPKTSEIGNKFTDIFVNEFSSVDRVNVRVTLITTPLDILQTRDFNLMMQWKVAQVVLILKDQYDDVFFFDDFYDILSRYSYIQFPNMYYHYYLVHHDKFFTYIEGF